MHAYKRASRLDPMTILSFSYMCFCNSDIYIIINRQPTVLLAMWAKTEALIFPVFILSQPKKKLNGIKPRICSGSAWTAANSKETNIHVQYGDNFHSNSFQTQPRKINSSIGGIIKTINIKNVICRGPIPPEKKLETISNSSGFTLGKISAARLTNHAGNRLIVSPPRRAVKYGCFSAFWIICFSVTWSLLAAISRLLHEAVLSARD